MPAGLTASDSVSSVWVCQNTLSWALDSAQQRYSIRHTEKVREHVHQARRVLELSVDYYRQFKQLGDRLASQPCSETQLRRVLDELYPSGATDVASNPTRRSREHTKQRLSELFLHGDTQGGAPGTKWAAVNAIIEYSDWIRPAGDRGQRFARALDDGARKTHAMELIAVA